MKNISIINDVLTIFEIDVYLYEKCACFVFTFYTLSNYEECFDNCNALSESYSKRRSDIIRQNEYGYRFNIEVFIRIICRGLNFNVEIPLIYKLMETTYLTIRDVRFSEIPCS